MQITNSVGEIDFAAMSDGETALALFSPGKWIRLWRRGNNLRLSLPIPEDQLTPLELSEVLLITSGLES